MAKAKSNGRAAKPPRTSPAPAGPQTESYQHPTATTPLRPDVGTQAQFKKKKPPAKYRYDSSLAPALDYDGQNPAREQGERHIAAVERTIAETLAELEELRRRVEAGDATAVTAERLKAATSRLAAAAESNRALKAMSRPFLNWSGKAERLSFDVPTLPLFVHERLSTRAIIETLTGHKRDQQLGLFDLFNDPQRPVADQVLKAYEHAERWSNRMVPGDSLVVMNSLLHYEGLGGQVQMIYMDPPYGVKFGSNFQPFVRKRDVSHNDDEDMTREPEMVQAYRDTWELGLHSYLTYLRDRLLLARELLTPSGSIFVQISDENLHHVKELLDEAFGTENFVSVIAFQKTGGLSQSFLPSTCDYLIWYARDKDRIKFRSLYETKAYGEGTDYQWVRLPDGRQRRMTAEEKKDSAQLLPGSKVFQTTSLESANPIFEFSFNGKKYAQRWKTNLRGLTNLAAANRLFEASSKLRYVRFVDDFPALPITNVWTDTGSSGFRDPNIYVVQTTTTVIQRCLLMTTDPGDLVLDPTCGSGTTAYVAEQWGRRWITADVSRVPLALARQRLLTATFPWYELKDEAGGPAGGFVYARRQNKKGEEVGGIVPHVTLKSIANNEPPDEEVLVDRPEEASKVTRITGPFAFEATIPTPVDWDDGDDASRDREGAVNGTGGPLADARGSRQESHGSFIDRMLEILRKSPVIRLDGGRTVTLRNVRVPARTLSLSAEATVDHAPGTPLTPAEAAQVSREQSGHSLPLSGKPVAIVIGPENGAISERLVWQGIMEAKAKGYAHVYVFGFAIQPNARKTIEDSAAAFDVPATYVQATPDLLMGDLLKNMRSSQVFSVCGLPEIKIHHLKSQIPDLRSKIQVELLGVDVFDPVSMETDGRKGNDVPAWFLDTDYNGLCFHVSQAFFPRTSAWDNLKKALKGTYDETVWDHLAGATSAPFEPGEHRQVAVKVIDDRGNELMVVKAI